MASRYLSVPSVPALKNLAVMASWRFKILKSLRPLRLRGYVFHVWVCPQFIVTLWLIFIFAFAFALPAFAQEPAATPEPVVSSVPVDTSSISDDAVYSVAEDLYCPVCENIPLDSCPTAACVQWREEIRIQLAEGQSREQIINNFVDRYGDRVVGVPQEPLLRGLSLITPWVIGAGVLAGGLWVLIQWRRGQRSAPATSGSSASVDEDALYRARLEADLVKRR